MEKNLRLQVILVTSLNNREKKLLIFAVVFIAGFSLYSYVLGPAYEKYQEVKERVGELEHDLQVERMELQGREKYQRELAMINRKIDTMESSFYDRDIREARLDFITVVDGGLRDNNLRVQNKEITMIPPGEEEKLTRLEYRLSFEGGLLDILRFLNKVTLGEKLYRVRELEIQAAQDEEDLSVYATIQAYCEEGENNEEI